MEKISFLCDKEITDMLKTRIEKTHHKSVFNQLHARVKLEFSRHR